MADSIKKAGKRATELRAELNRHNHLYHVADAAEVDDRTYDLMYRELELLEAIVGRKVPSGFGKQSYKG